MIQKKQLEVQRQMEAEKLKRQQEQLANEIAQMKREKEQETIFAEAEKQRIQQLKNEVQTRGLKNQLDRNDWLQKCEQEEYKERKRREAQEFDDERADKKVRVSKGYQSEESNNLWNKEQVSRRETFERKMHAAAVLDNFRNERVSAQDTSDILRSLFTDTPRNGGEEHKKKKKHAPEIEKCENDDAEKEAEEDVFDPFADGENN